MTLLMSWAIAEFVIGVVVAARSRYVTFRRTAGLWAAQFALSLLVFHHPGAGIWAVVMSAPSPGRMLTLASAVLALLLFAANFFNGVAKPDKDAERYFGVCVDGYYNSRSWFADAMLSPTFRGMTIGLFLMPLGEPWTSRWAPWASPLVASIWCGCLGLVFTILLLNVTSVLRGALMRLNRRESVRRQIRDEVARGVRRQAVIFSHGHDLDLMDWWLDQHLEQMATLPSEQQRDYFDVSVGSRTFGAQLGDRWRVAQHLMADQRRLWVTTRELLAGTRIDWDGSLPGTIMRTIDRVEHGRAVATAKAYGGCPEAEMRERLLSELVQIGREMDRRVREGGAQPEVRRAFCRPVQIDAGLLEQPFRRFVPYGRDATDPEYVRVTAECFAQVITFRFPRSDPSSCTQRQLLDLERTLSTLDHASTRDELLSYLARELLRATVTHRIPNETLPLGAARSTFLRRPYGLDGGPDTHRMSRSLAGAAFSALIEDQGLSREARAELLFIVDDTHCLASLIHLLQYRHRSHRGVGADDLAPYRARLQDSDLGSVDRDWVCGFVVRSTIGHFFTAGDVDWLFASLGKTLDMSLIAAHEERLIGSPSDFPLQTLLLWRGSVKDLGWSLEVGPLPDLPPYRLERVEKDVRSCARILEDVQPGLGDAVLYRTPWAPR